MAKIFRWLPPILGALFILFISLFALDAFAAGQPFIRQVAGFIIHLIPSFILVGVLAIGWRWPRIAGLIFIGLAVAALFFFSGPARFFLLAGPLSLLGILFLIGGSLKKPG